MPKKKKESKAKSESTKPAKSESTKSVADKKTLGDAARLEQELKPEALVDSSAEPDVSEVETAPVKRKSPQIDPNLLAGKAMLLINAIEDEIERGHLPEWTAVAERVQTLLESHANGKSGAAKNPDF